MTLGTCTYNDHYLYVLARSFAERVMSGIGEMGIGSSEYDQVTFRYFATTLREFPADFIVRLYAAAIGVLTTPFDLAAELLPSTPGTLGGAVAARADAASWMAWPAAVSGVITLVAILGAGGRMGGFAIITVAVLAASTALQYHPRHFFYLEFAAWWPLAAVLDVLLSGDRRRSIREQLAAVRWRRIIAAFLLVPLTAAAILAVARRYQGSRVRATLSRLSEVNVAPVPLTVALSGDRIRFMVSPIGVFPQGSAALAHPVATAYFAIDFGGTECERLTVSPTFRYESSRPYEDFSRTMEVSLPLDGRVVRTYWPAFDARFERSHSGSDMQFNISSFFAVELPAGDRGCLSAVRRVNDASLPPILPTAVLSDGWERSPLYQRFRWEVREAPPQRILSIAGEEPRRRDASRVLSGPYLSEKPRLAPGMVMNEGGQLRFDGVAEGPFTYVVTSTARVMPAGAIGGVRGVLEKGGVTVGLLKDGAWAGNVNVLEPGPFTVVLRTPGDGRYEIVVAHSLLEGERTNRFMLEKFGWLDSTAAPSTPGR
jgi:hypothetical protein